MTGDPDMERLKDKMQKKVTNEVNKGMLLLKASHLERESDKNRL